MRADCVDTAARRSLPPPPPTADTAMEDPEGTDPDKHADANCEASRSSNPFRRRSGSMQVAVSDIAHDNGEPPASRTETAAGVVSPPPTQDVALTTTSEAGEAEVAIRESSISDGVTLGPDSHAQDSTVSQEEAVEGAAYSSASADREGQPTASKTTRSRRLPTMPDAAASDLVSMPEDGKVEPEATLPIEGARPKAHTVDALDTDGPNFRERRKRMSGEWTWTRAHPDSHAPLGTVRRRLPKAPLAAPEVESGRWLFACVRARLLIDFATQAKFVK